MTEDSQDHRATAPAGLGESLPAVNKPWREAIDAYLAHLRSKGDLATTLRLRSMQAHRFALDHNDQDPATLTTGDIHKWIASHEWSRSTIASQRGMLREFYAALVVAGLSPTDPCLGFTKMKRSTPAAHPTPDEVLATALARASERERLIMHLAGRCGLRRGEIAKMRGDSVHGSDGAWSVYVTGKGDKTRVVPMADDIAHAVRARGPGWTFPGSDGGHLSPGWVGTMISRMMPHGWTLHSLRHRFATRAYAGTRDIVTVQQILGHSSVATTQIYVRAPDDAMRRAMMAAS